MLGPDQGGILNENRCNDYPKLGIPGATQIVSGIVVCMYSHMRQQGCADSVVVFSLVYLSHTFLLSARVRRGCDHSEHGAPGASESRALMFSFVRSQGDR